GGRCSRDAGSQAPRAGSCARIPACWTCCAIPTATTTVRTSRSRKAEPIHPRERAPRLEGEQDGGEKDERELGPGGGADALVRLPDGQGDGRRGCQGRVWRGEEDDTRSVGHPTGSHIEIPIIRIGAMR